MRLLLLVTLRRYRLRLLFTGCYLREAGTPRPVPVAGARFWTPAVTLWLDVVDLRYRPHAFGHTVDLRLRLIGLLVTLTLTI